MTLKVLDLFAGAGGFTLAGEMAGGYEAWRLNIGS